MKATTTTVRHIDVECPGNKLIRVSMFADEVRIEGGFAAPWHPAFGQTVTLPIEKMDELVEALRSLSEPEPPRAA
ncbi:MAG: hypothetical protein GEU90_00650 [Gemmatimonas sp.]|nr:hypothetical protein [Gemmatimonas sp.]